MRGTAGRVAGNDVRPRLSRKPEVPDLSAPAPPHHGRGDAHRHAPHASCQQYGRAGANARPGPCFRSRRQDLSLAHGRALGRISRTLLATRSHFCVFPAPQGPGTSQSRQAPSEPTAFHGLSMKRTTNAAIKSRLGRKPLEVDSEVDSLVDSPVHKINSSTKYLG